MKLYPKIGIFFIAWVSAVYIVSYFGFLSFPLSLKFEGNFLERLAQNWDGGHFVAIAQSGYTEKEQFAFFPLYPLVVRVVNFLIGNYPVSAILVSILSSFLAVKFFYKLVLKDYGKDAAIRACGAMLFFPTSFYLLTGYSEGLFLFFTIAAFYFLRENKLLAATIFCILASGTRLAGIAVSIAFLFEILTERGINKKNFFVLLSPFGLVFYGVYLFIKTSDPLYFVTAEAFWQRYLNLPGNAVLATINSISIMGITKENVNVLTDLLFTIFGIGMVIRGFRFFRSSYAIYGLLSILLPLFTSSLTSMPRFLLPVFPIFILIALVKNHNVLFFYQVFSIMFLAVFAILFVNGYWVS